MAGPWEKYQKGSQSAPAVPEIIELPASPSEQRKEARDARGEQRDEVRLDISERGEKRDEKNTAFNQTQSLMGAYDALPAVKEFRAVSPILISGVRAAQKGDATGDNTLLYAYAKVMDPASVVRESEQAMALGGAAFWDQKVSELKKQLGMDGGGMLPQKVRDRLVRDMNSKISAMSQSYQVQRDRFRGRAESAGINPQDVIGQHDFDTFRADYDKLMAPYRGQNQNNPLQIPGGPGGTGAPKQFAQGERYSTPEDYALARAVQEVYNKGGSVRDMAAAASGVGYKVVPQDITQWSEAVKYRDNPGRKGPLPSVQPRQSGVRNALQENFGNFAASGTGAALTGMADAWTFGGLDEVTGAVNSVFSGRGYDAERDWADMGKQAQREVNGGAYLGGQLEGGITQGLLGAQLLKAFPAAQKVMQSTPGMIAGGGTYGGINGALENNSDRISGAIDGAGAGVLGASAGRYVLGPAAEAFMRMSGPQAASEFVRGALRRLPGMENRVAPKAVVPQFGPGERMIPNTRNDLQNIRVNLQDAARLGLPYSLADSSPKLRKIGGSASRISADAGEFGERVFDPRQDDQAERAMKAIERDFAPPVDIGARDQMLKEAGDRMAGPLYDQAFAPNTPAWSPRIQQFLDDPMSQEGLRKGLEIQRLEALAEGKPFDPMQFSVTGFDEAGNPILSKTPNLRAVDAIRRGYGAILDDLPKNPYGKPIHTSRSRAITLAKDALTSELDDLAKRSGNTAFSEARETYGQFQGLRGALQDGYDAAPRGVYARDVERRMDQMTPDERAEYQAGYATRLRDMVSNASDSENPWKTLYGGNERRLKIQSVFPEGNDNFSRQFALEGDMGKTYQEVRGGSATAGRQQADAAFADSTTGQVLDIGMQAVASGGAVSPLSLWRLAQQKAGDRLRMGLSRKAAEQRANNVAGILFNTDPNWAMNYLDDLAVRQAQDALRKQAFQRRGALLGTSAVVPFVAGSNQ